jgi:hypothetical protein
MEPSELLAATRAAHYRELAKAADEYAATTIGGVSQAYQRMADNWRKLADEIEAGAKADNEEDVRVWVLAEPDLLA